MPVKMSGVEFKRWLQSDWGPDAMWEDYVLEINGEPIGDDDDRATEDIVQDGDSVVLRGGVIFPDQNDIQGVCPVDAEKHARKWLKEQATTSFIVEVDKAQTEAVKALLRERFGSALKIIS